MEGDKSWWNYNRTALLMETEAGHSTQPPQHQVGRVVWNYRQPTKILKERRGHEKIHNLVWLEFDLYWFWLFLGNTSL